MTTATAREEVTGRKKRRKKRRKRKKERKRERKSRAERKEKEKGRFPDRVTGRKTRVFRAVTLVYFSFFVFNPNKIYL